MCEGGSQTTNSLNLHEHKPWFEDPGLRLEKYPRGYCCTGARSKRLKVSGLRRLFGWRDLRGGLCGIGPAKEEGDREAAFMRGRELSSVRERVGLIY